MRVLYVIDSVVGGGAEQSLAALAPRLVGSGVDLVVAYLQDRPGLQPELETSGVRLFCLDGPGGRAGWTARIYRLIGHIRPDLVHTTLFEADLAGRAAAVLRRVPVVSSLVNTAYGPEHVGDPGLKSWRVKAGLAADVATARSVTRFHAVTHDVAATMAPRLRVDRERIDVVWRGRDAQKLGRRTDTRRQAARAELNAGREVTLLIAVARQEYQKGLDVLLEALPHVQGRGVHPHLVVVGRVGNQTAMLRALVSKLGLDSCVTFLGARADVAELMCGADLCVLPSRREGLPGVLLEAMALEVPIVATDLPGVREAVGDHGVATLVAPEDHMALAKAIGEALADCEAAAQGVDRGRARFESNFTIERSAEGMLAFYRRALNLADSQPGPGSADPVGSDA